MFKLTPILLVLGAPPVSTPCVPLPTTELISGSKFVYLGTFGARNQRLRPLTEKVTAVNLSLLSHLKEGYKPKPLLLICIQYHRIQHIQMLHW